jgi:hypothetical protein
MVLAIFLPRHRHSQCFQMQGSRDDAVKLHA